MSAWIETTSGVMVRETQYPDGLWRVEQCRPGRHTAADVCRESLRGYRTRGDLAAALAFGHHCWTEWKEQVPWDLRPTS